MFKIINLSLGNIKVGSKNILIFPYIDIQDIKSMSAPCSCSELTNYKLQSRIEVTYIAKDIPEHLKILGEPQQINIPITVNYVPIGENSVEQTIILSFNAIVSK